MSFRETKITMNKGRIYIPTGEDSISVAYRKIASSKFLRLFQKIFGGKRWMVVGVGLGKKFEIVDVNRASLKKWVSNEWFGKIKRSGLLEPRVFFPREPAIMPLKRTVRTWGGSDEQILARVNRENNLFLSLGQVQLLRRKDGKAIYVKVRQELRQGGFKHVFSLFKFNFEKNKLTKKVELKFNSLGDAKDYKKENALLKEFGGNAFIMKAAKQVELVGGEKIWVQDRAEMDLMDASEYREVTAAMHVPLSLKMALAVQALHNKGMIHRDIKPDNYLLMGKDDRGVPELKLTDFGFVTRPEHATTRKGTLDYEAPEGNFTKAADIHQLGQTLYATVTRRERRPKDQMRDTDFVGVNLLLKNLILRCVDQDPKGRPEINDVVFLLRMMLEG